MRFNEAPNGGSAPNSVAAEWNRRMAAACVQPFLSRAARSGESPVVTVSHLPGAVPGEQV